MTTITARRVLLRAPARALPNVRVAVPRRPLYPAVVTTAFILFDYAASNVSLEALWRPLLVAGLVTVLLQLVLTLILRDRDRGAYLALVVQFALLGLGVVSLVLVGWLLAAVAIAAWRRRGLRLIPWLRATRVINAVAILFLVEVVATTGMNGGFVFAGSTTNAPRGAAAADAPDIYLILLDGYPRADTLETRFDFDNTPFLSSMQSMGFDVATASHSNYDSTVLTLTSVFNGAQIPDLIPQPPASRAAQFRLISQLINEGTDLQRLRSAGYEIVSIPTEYYEGALLNADRVLNSGHLSSFEMQLLQTGALPEAFGGVERTWLMEEHRGRIFSAFSSLESLAAERDTGPKMVFGHFLVPHMPVAFKQDGSLADGLSCFPKECTIFSYGDEQRAEMLQAMRDQVSWLNGQVEQTVATIQAESARPPVIVIFSDHGTRFWAEDHAEMYRSLLLTSTPGQAGVFPNDATPVNLLSRVIDRYTNQSVPLASEESYWLDTRQVDRKGVLALTPIP